jgi:hypothetical protein
MIEWRLAAQFGPDPGRSKLESPTAEREVIVDHYDGVGTRPKDGGHEPRHTSQRSQLKANKTSHRSIRRDELKIENVHLRIGRAVEIIGLGDVHHDRVADATPPVRP